MAIIRICYSTCSTISELLCRVCVYCVYVCVCVCVCGLSLEAQRSRWQEHFTRVLNIQSVFDPTVFDHISQRELCADLSRPPGIEELNLALRALANGKAAGSSGVVAEFIKYGAPALRPRLINLLADIWASSCVPQDWRDAELVPIPKKGNLSSCDNWRGISLLDVVGKLCGRILQNRLQFLADSELPESQCGFRSGRGCMDAVFSVRQLVEKTFEHRQKTFCVFVDLRKAYDSVPRQALWLALLKLGVPPDVVSLIGSFHTGMRATVRVPGGFTDGIHVRNGLRQGCVMAPVLFNLFFGLVVERWSAVLLERGIEAGVAFRHMIGALFPRSVRRAVPGAISDIEYADDAVLFASTRLAAERCTAAFSEVASSFGLCMSVAKTQFFVAGHGVTVEDRMGIQVGEGVVECVPSFVYLGSVITPDSRSADDVARRIANAAKAFGALLNVFQDPALSLSTKRHLYTACVTTTLLYGSECLTPLRADLARLDKFHHRCLRAILGVSRTRQWEEHISSAQLRERWGDAIAMSDRVRHRRLEWLGHVARLDPERVPKQLLFSHLLTSRPACGPRRRWRDVIREDLREVPNWFAVATDRTAWRNFINTPAESGQPSPAIVCDICYRSFRRPCDMARHKCKAERQLPLHLQRGALQCPVCSRWFASKGGLAVHKCSLVDADPITPLPPTITVAASGRLVCQQCQRHFTSSGFKRHNCNRGQRPSRQQRDGFPYQCQSCPEKFRRPQDLARHAVCRH